MSCAHPYDWQDQSLAHQSYADSYFPMIAFMAGEADANGGGASQFDKVAASLTPAERLDYKKDYDLWWDSYGRAWDEMGCPTENIVGEHTGSYKLSGKDIAVGDSTVMDIQRQLLKAGYNPGPVDGKWGPKTCAAAYAFNKNVLRSYDPKLTKDFFSKLGFDFANSENLAKAYGDSCTRWYSQFGTTLQASDVQAVQQMLRAKGFVTTVDGVLGPETCRNLYLFQTKLGVVDCTLRQETFFALNFDEAYAAMYSQLFTGPCKGSCPGAVAPKPPVVVKKCTPAAVQVCTCSDGKPGKQTCAQDGMAWGSCVADAVVVKEKKPFPWWLVGAIVGVGVLLGVAVMKDDDKKGRKK